MSEVIMADVVMAESLDQESQPVVHKAFPGEIHNQIAGLLGPVDLISLSQANRYFRQLINPGQKEFAERLFVIECDEKHGGGTSLYQKAPGIQIHRHQTLEPFEANRWACPGCLQLLPHYRFDNRSIYWLATRKPMPGTPAADVASSWVPTQHREDSAEEDKRISKEICTYYTKGQSIADSEDDRFRANERCGYARHKRRCIECLYQLRMIGGSARGELSPLPRSPEERAAGKIKVTSTLTSRGVMLPSGFVRFWPKLDEMIQNKAPSITPLGPRSIPWRREDKLWDMYMIRCTGCEEWKELRAFRIEGSRMGWTPPCVTMGIPQWLPRGVATDDVPKLVNRPLEELRCNHCFAREHGAERLGEILTIRFDMNIKPHLSELEYRLHSHYKAVKYLAAEGAAAERHRPKKEDPSGDFDELVRLVRQAEENNKELSNRLWKLNQADVARLRTEAKEFKDIWLSMRASQPRLASKLGRDRAFVSWVNDFDNSEIEWKWLKECQVKIMENPDMLLQYALNVDAPGCCYPSAG